MFVTVSWLFASLPTFSSGRLDSPCDEQNDKKEKEERGKRRDEEEMTRKVEEEEEKIKRFME